MMRRIASTLVLLSCAHPVVAEPPPLTNNPFSRPPAPLINEAIRHEGDTATTPLVVIATMVSSTSALANIEGQVLRPGQEINGYLLKRVYENRAVFERDGNELTVYVKPELEENDVRTRTNPRRR
ncbi:MAG: hypothetical protein QNJ11_00230 [Woeseiaceae bacterium]|nr:hypothetical protein [Woeseiaceae bacterium]